MRWKGHLAVVPAAVIAIGLAACGGNNTDSGGQGGGSMSAAGARLNVVATTTQVADFARNIGGDRITLTQILTPNVDPHDFEPSPADLTALSRADVLIENGVGLEAWLDDTVQNSGFAGLRVDASKGVPLRRGEGEEAGEDDPHIWHNPANVTIMVQNIADGLIQKDAADEATYRTNLSTYQGKLDALDREIQQQIDSIPAAQRKLVTNHDAFGYYIDHYHLRFIGSIIPSLNTSAELSGKQIQDIVAKIRQTGVKAVFSESSLPPNTAETIGREAGVTVVAGEDALYGDTLGPAGSAGATYLDMERHNTTVIVSALRG